MGIPPSSPIWWSTVVPQRKVHAIVRFSCVVGVGYCLTLQQNSVNCDVKFEITIASEHSDTDMEYVNVRERIITQEGETCKLQEKSWVVWYDRPR